MSARRLSAAGRICAVSACCGDASGVFCAAGTIGSGFVLSAGYALAAKKDGKGQVVLCFSGDGGVQRGQAHEAMNMAAVWKLPVVWIVENNLYAWFTPSCDTTPLENIADMAKAYKMPGVIVDGMDVEAVYKETYKAVERARKGDGPTLIECKTYRYRPHSEGRPDVSHYQPRDKEEIMKWKERDPVVIFRERLMKKGILTQEMVDEINEKFDREIEEAEKHALESPYPDPSILEKIVYAP